jgi:hypothetical protein
MPSHHPRALLLACALAGLPALVLPASASAAAKTMRFRVLNGTSSTLTVQDRTLAKGHWRGDGPVNARPLRVADFTMESESNQAKGDIRWRIGTSDYLLKVWGNVDGPASNCAIQTLDRKDTASSPFSCREHRTGGNDSDQYTVVQPKDASTTTTVAGQRRREVYETLCGTAGAGATGYASCRIDVIHEGAGPGAPTRTGDILVNCGPSTLSGEIGWSHTFGETNTLGGSLGFEVETPGKVFQNKLEVSYERNWTSSRTDTRAVTQGVPSGSYGWVDDAPQVRKFITDIVATVGNQTFDIPRVDVSAPLSSGPAATDIARGGALPAGYCDGTSRVAISHEIPQDAPDPGEVYALGLRGANQRVISSSGNSGSLTLDSFGQRAGQRWQLEPDGDGGYRIRSDADLDRCVEQSTATIIEQPCGTAAAQRWTLVASADNTSFQLKSKLNDRVIGLSSDDRLVPALPASTGVKTQWELVHA